METRTAVVFGATGLIGRALIEELCKSERYISIKIFVRRKTDFCCKEKIKEILIDFNNLKEYSYMITGDDLFICLGTTIKKAGSVRRMEEIDRDLPLTIASVASGNSIDKVVIISSLGADIDSSNYYLRIKGEMEKGLIKLKFRTLIILRPSILLGDRNERRRGEEVGKILVMMIGIFLVGKLSRYRGIEGKNVAKVMVKAINEKSGIEILESDKIHQISKDK
jgi:uncharacterized protein YbjT (DUF2867 family)